MSRVVAVPARPWHGDIETFYELIYDHAQSASCEIVPDLIESVERTGDEEGLHVTPWDGEFVTSRRVMAATSYDGEHMLSLDDAAMFERR